MPYILNKTNGSVLATIADGSINRSTDLTFVGKNYAGYGEISNENLLRLLENFSNSTAPEKPITGQIWYDAANKRIKVYDGANFRGVPYAEASVAVPSNLNIGDFWFDTTANQLYVKNGVNSFVLVGPPAVTTNTDIVILTSVSDEDGNIHLIAQVVIDNEIVGVISNDEFTLAGDEFLLTSGNFSTIYKGYTLSGANATTGKSSNNGYYFWGTAAHALRLGEYAASDYLLASVYNSALSGGMVIDSNNGILIGSGGVIRVCATSSTEGNIVGVTAETINVSVKSGASNPKVLSVGANALVPGSDKVGTYCLGTTGNRFCNTFSDILTGNSVKVDTICATTLTCGGTVCGTTLVRSPTICGTTNVCSPIFIGATCISVPTVCSSTMICSAGAVNSNCVCASTCARSPIICASSCFIGNVLCSTAGILSGTWCLPSGANLCILKQPTVAADVTPKCYVDFRSGCAISNYAALSPVPYIPGSCPASCIIACAGTSLGTLTFDSTGCKVLITASMFISFAGTFSSTTPVGYTILMDVGGACMPNSVMSGALLLGQQNIVSYSMVHEPVSGSLNYTLRAAQTLCSSYTNFSINRVVIHIRPVPYSLI